MNKKIKILIKSIIIAILLVVIAIMSFVFINMLPKDSSNKKTKEIVIESGSSRLDIANKLEKEGIIKNSKVFYYYTKVKKATNIYAATYKLSPSMNVKKVLKVLLLGGTNTNTAMITIKEGQNMRTIAKTIEQNSQYSYDEIINKQKDETYLNSLIEKYWFLTEDIKNKNIYYPLEGYLYPDTYNIDKNSNIEDIYKIILDETDNVLKKYKKAFEKSNYTIHELITVASIIESETQDESSRKDVSSVFYNRIKNGMSLGADATTYYAFKIDLGERDLTMAELNSNNPYNTRGPEMIGKLPVGPISSPSKSSIEAALYPNNTSYLYYVSDKDGKIYLTKNETDHDKIIKELQDKGMWYEW